MKRPALIVLKALYQGIPVPDPEGNLYYFLNGADEFGFQYESERGGEQMHLADWSLNWFLSFCDKIPEETLISLAAAIALQETK